MERKITIIGAGINGLVAANYLQRAGCQVTLIEKKDKVGGAAACEFVELDGKKQYYATGASVFGLMQKFVWEETGLSKRLKKFTPPAPDLVHFDGVDGGVSYHHDPVDLARELKEKWGEEGRIEEYASDMEKVTAYLIQGYQEARTPSIEDAKNRLGEELSSRWITGSARDLVNHYFTSEQPKVVLLMMMAESSPVSCDAPYSAVNIPLILGGSVFDGGFGFVEGGMWKITEALESINQELGVNIHVSASVEHVDTDRQTVRFIDDEQHVMAYDDLVFATDPMTTCKLVGKEADVERTNQLKFQGTAGKLNLIFKNPIRWKEGDDTRFRYVQNTHSVAEFDAAVSNVLEGKQPYVPAFMHFYSEGAAMRQMGVENPYERMAAFIGFFSLEKKGAELPEVEAEIKAKVLSYIENPEDCIWTKLLTPKDLQELFFFPGGNYEHTMLTNGQVFDGRNHSAESENSFYNFGDYDNIYACSAGSYPSGSVTGTPGYMCSQQLLRKYE
jgi:phytoene dehydrogenase-like protein